MTAKRFMLDDAGELIDLNTHKFVDYGEECCNLLNALHEEKEIYKRLFNEMAYYFRGNVKSLNDLDHKDFESLQLLSQGEYFDEESLCWCKVKLEDLE
jgi:hypothetical protein